MQCWKFYYTSFLKAQYVVWKKVSNSTHSFDVKKNTKYKNYPKMSYLKLCRMRLFIDIFKHFVKEKGKKGFLDELFLPIPPDILTGKLCKRRNLWNWSRKLKLPDWIFLCMNFEMRSIKYVRRWAPFEFTSFSLSVWRICFLRRKSSVWQNHFAEVTP